MRGPTFLALTVVLLAGCVPTTFTYYKPIGPGSYFKPCGGGADNYLGFKVNDGLGVMIHTGVPAFQGAATDDLNSISVSFQLGEGHILQMPTPTFAMVSADSPESRQIAVSEVSRVDYVQLPDKRWERKVLKFPAGSRLEGGLLPDGFRSLLYVDFQNWIAYGLSLPVNQRGGRNFSLRFPQVLLDEKPVEIPTIRIEYDTYAHFRFFC